MSPAQDQTAKLTPVRAEAKLFTLDGCLLLLGSLDEPDLRWGSPNKGRIARRASLDAQVRRQEKEMCRNRCRKRWPGWVSSVVEMLAWLPLSSPPYFLVTDLLG